MKSQPQTSLKSTGAEVTVVAAVPMVFKALISLSARQLRQDAVVSLQTLHPLLGYPVCPWPWEDSSSHHMLAPSVCINKAKTQTHISRWVVPTVKPEVFLYNWFREFILAVLIPS